MHNIIATVDGLLTPKETERVLQIDAATLADVQERGYLKPTRWRDMTFFRICDVRWLQYVLQRCRAISNRRRRRR